MTRILVLSKNILADQSFQLELQRLNYEVLVSVSMYEYLVHHKTTASLLDSFSTIIFSETLTDSEIEGVVYTLKEEECPVIRRVFSYPNEEEQQTWEDKGICDWINVNETLINVKEHIENNLMLYNRQDELVLGISGSSLGNPVPLFSSVNFTPLERKILQKLFSKEGEFVSREELCLAIWNEHASDSRKTQLSATTAQLRKKMATFGDENKYLRTQWGKGYCLTKDFYRDFKIDDNFGGITHLNQVS